MALRRIVLAQPSGFCSGVERAVTMVEAALAASGEPLYCFRELVHNRQVIAALAGRGVVFVDDLAAVPAGGRVVFSAHGVAPAVYLSAAERGLKVIDATCPFVARVHARVRGFVVRGCRVLLVGHRGHDEVRGIVGEAPEHVQVIENEQEAWGVQVPAGLPLAVVTQTTLSMMDTAQVMRVLKHRFPDLEGLSRHDICHATQKRQLGVMQLARQTDLVLVLGAANSSNTNRLVEVARAVGGRAQLISQAGDLTGLELASLDTVGVTAGASTPESFVREVVAILSQHGSPEATTLRVSSEEVPPGVSEPAAGGEL